ncbi:unnamed protein product [Amoebophrya sp. A25]|nr:unnamed protein product [Amoebophrya sp. A25]|eukprot:GSA25T00024561001.1
MRDTETEHHVLGGEAALSPSTGYYTVETEANFGGIISDLVATLSGGALGGDELSVGSTREYSTSVTTGHQSKRNWRDRSSWGVEYTLSSSRDRPDTVPVQSSAEGPAVPEAGDNAVQLAEIGRDNQQVAQVEVIDEAILDRGSSSADDRTTTLLGTTTVSRPTSSPARTSGGEQKPLEQKSLAELALAHPLTPASSSTSQRVGFPTISTGSPPPCTASAAIFRPWDEGHGCVAHCASEFSLPIALLLLAIGRLWVRRKRDRFLLRIRDRENLHYYQVFALLQIVLLLPLLSGSALGPVLDDQDAVIGGGVGLFAVLAYTLFFLISFVLTQRAAASTFLWGLACAARFALLNRSLAAAWQLSTESSIFSALSVLQLLQLSGDFVASIQALATFGLLLGTKLGLLAGRRTRTASLAQLLLESGQNATDLHSLAELEKELTNRIDSNLSPEEEAGLFGRISFNWFTPVVRFCYAKQQQGEQLQMEQVPPLPAEDLCHVHYLRLKREWEKELREYGANGSLTHALTRTFATEALFGWQGVLKLVSDLMHFLNPFLLNTLLKYLQDDSTKNDSLKGWLLAVAMCLTSLWQAICLTHYFQIGYRCAMHVRSALIMLVFQKSLKLVPGAFADEKEASAGGGSTSVSGPAQQVTAAQLGSGPRSSWVQKLLAAFLPEKPGKSDYEGSVGQIMNLVTADTDRFSLLMPYLNLLWSAPLQLFLCFFFLAYYVGWATIGGLIVMGISFVISSQVQQRAQALQRDVMKAKDERLKIQNELLNAIKMVKIYGWEFQLRDRVREIRDRELFLQKRVRQWSGIQWLQFTIAPGFVGAATFYIHCIVFGRELDPATAFTSLALFSVIGFPLGVLPMLLQWLIQSQVAVIRLEAFLKKPEVQGTVGADSPAQQTTNSLSPGALGGGEGGGARTSFPEGTGLTHVPALAQTTQTGVDEDYASTPVRSPRATRTAGSLSIPVSPRNAAVTKRREALLQRSLLLSTANEQKREDPLFRMDHAEAEGALLPGGPYPVARNNETELASSADLSPRSVASTASTAAGSTVAPANPRNQATNAPAKTIKLPAVEASHPTGILLSPPSQAFGPVAVEYEWNSLTWPNGVKFLENPAATVATSKVDVRNGNVATTIASSKGPQEGKFHFRMGELIAVVGPTGAGKTGFITGLLGELSNGSGVEKNVIRGRGVRYCAQAPWVCNKTLRENVTWGAASSSSSSGAVANKDTGADAATERNYQDTLFCSALLPDLDVLPDGDDTQIGDRGVTLSGGQKARVAIARAIYDVNDADVFIFDDVLSAVDSHVAAHLRTEVFRGRLRPKCVLLATHDENTVRLADRIVHIGRPKAVVAAADAPGNTMPYSGANGSANGSEPATSGAMPQLVAEARIFDSYEAYRAAVPQDSSESNEDSDEASSDEGVDDGETALQLGPAVTRGLSNASSGGSHRAKSRTKSNESAGKGKDAGASPKETTTKSPNGTSVGENTKAGGGVQPGSSKSAAAPSKEEEREKGSVSFDCYVYYLRAMGGWKWITMYFIALVCSESSTVLSNTWIGHWSDSVGQMSSASGLSVYCGILICGTFFLFCFIVYRVIMGQNAARKLHMDCQTAVLRAKMSWLDVTPVGRILNRFAEDTVIIDNNLATTVSLNCQWLYRLTAIFVLASRVSLWTLALFVPIWMLFLQTQRFYIPSARDLRRLDTVNKSPIFSHFAETLIGLSTIRVHRLEKVASKLNVEKLQRQLQVYFLANCANRWLSLRMQLTGTMLVSGVCFFAIAMRSYLVAGVVGLAIMYSLKLTDTLNALNRESADLETQMISVERLRQYVEQVPSEAPLETEEDSSIVLNGPGGSEQSWPSAGRVEFQNVSLRYRDELPLVLRNVTLSVPAGTSLGICGRTGSGKSSLLLSLMRMVEPVAPDSVQKIDGRDISRLGLHYLRKSLMIIPQDPVIFSGTVRFNLDPFKESSDEEMLSALELAQLTSKLGTNLDAEVAEGGGNFSHGEKQLLALARAILRKPKGGNGFHGILLLDEATSALDPELDRTIQSVLRSHFARSTIVTIAHRISTILDYDAVAVLENGRVVEYGEPKKLLRKGTASGKFAALAAGATGSGSTTASSGALSTLG